MYNRYQKPRNDRRAGICGVLSRRVVRAAARLFCAGFLGVAVLFSSVTASAAPSDGSRRGAPASPAFSTPVDGDRIIFGSIGEASNLIPYLTSDSASHEVADLLYVAPCA